jgi:DNA primase catalytic core
MKISFKDLSMIKEINLPEIIKSYGIPEGNRTNGTYSFKCPFHPDHNPSLKVNQKGSKWLWHCFGCGAGGNTLSFVMKYEKTSLLGAYGKLIKQIGPQKLQIPNPTSQINPKNQIPNIQKDEIQPVIKDFNPSDLLKRVTDFYHETFKEDRRALEYLVKRGLKDQDIYLNFKIGFANGSLKDTLPLEGPMVEALKSLGILNAKGNEVFYNRVIFPIRDEDGNVVSLYGRKLPDTSLKSQDTSLKTYPYGRRQDLSPKHLYLAGPHRGVFNCKVLSGTERIFLTESIIDSLSLYQLGIRESIALYGTNGLTKAHIELLQKHRIKEAILCLDNDEAGETAGQKISLTLKESGIKTSKIKLPDGIKDPNDYLISGKSKEEFIRLVEKTEYSIQNSEDRKDEKQRYPEISEDETQLTFNFSSRSYRIRGLTWNRLDQLRVNIKLKYNGNYHLDTLDLYSAKQRQVFTSQAGKVLQIDIADINTDLNYIVEHLEKIQAKKAGAQAQGAQTKKEMIEAEKQEALEFLNSPDLLDKIVSDFKTCGYVGEESNVLLGYLASISRKLNEPLALLIVSRSAAGKSALQNAILDFTPEEDFEKYTRLTDQALFYKGEESLKHKLLAIEEEQGANGAGYSLRNLQSAQSLKTASTIKDPLTGKLKTDVYTVKGPTAIMLTTTYHENFDYETYNRFIILTIDESMEQTRLILEKQRKNQSIEGIMLKQQKEKIKTKHHNSQRILKPVEVVNPYSEQLTFIDNVLRARREQPKYLALIKTIALLRQYQKEIKIGFSENESFEYIEVELKDIETANKIANEILGHSLSEMSPPSRRLLEEIKKLVDKKCREENISQEKCVISRRDIREYSRWSEYQIRAHIGELEELEYLIPVAGRQGKRFTYILAWDGQGSDGEKFILGLKDTACLEKFEGNNLTSRVLRADFVEQLTY